MGIIPRILTPLCVEKYQENMTFGRFRQSTPQPCSQRFKTWWGPFGLSIWSMESILQLVDDPLYTRYDVVIDLYTWFLTKKRRHISRSTLCEWSRSLQSQLKRLFSSHHSPWAAWAINYISLGSLQLMLRSFSHSWPKLALLPWLSWQHPERCHQPFPQPLYSTHQP